MIIQSEKVVSNFLWRFMERCGAQGVSFVVSIVLARLLDPEIYGTVALVSVIITILQVLVDSGLGNALIQKKDADSLDFSTVFFANLILCGTLYICVFLAAPLIAKYYGIKSLTPLIRIQSLILIVYGVKNVQESYVARNMLFKRFFFATLGGTIGAAFIGIWMAYRGYGVWALVVQHLFNVTVDTLILWITVKWRPCNQFSFVRLRILFSYGWKLLITNLMDTTYNDLRSLIIGKKYSKSDLAFYERGRIIPNLAAVNANTSISNVLFPTLSSVQDDKARIYEMIRRSIKISLYILSPIMVGLALCGEQLVEIVYSAKWLPCVPFLIVYCCYYLFQPMQTSHNNMLKAIGRSDLFLKIEIIKKSIGISILLITMWFGVKTIAAGMLIDCLVCWIIHAIVYSKMINYTFREQITDILPNLVPALIMGVITYFASLKIEGIYLNLMAKILIGVFAYLTISIVSKNESCKYLFRMINRLFCSSFNNK